MKLPTIKEADLDGKRVLMRVDFNVSYNNGRPEVIYKIKKAQKTIDYILSKPKVKLALLSHYGRPKGKDNDYSFKINYKEIGSVLKKKLIFVPDCVGEEVKEGLEKLNEGEVLMLENVRFYGGEALCDEKFARELSENFDVYVNESFGVDHRKHASTVCIVKMLPSFIGFNVEEEIKVLSEVRNNFERPAIAIIGGAKIDTKISMIQFFSENYDYVLVGGKLGLEAKGRDIVFKENVILPEDYAGNGFDIGDKTIKIFKDYVSKARMIVWNGPLGKFEDPKFAKGTDKVLEAMVANKSARKVAGGGETIQVLETKGYVDKFDFVSTGGGAMLDFMVDGTIPTIEAFMAKNNI